ncbi:MAG TPA: hypothetical protein VL202_15130 [Pararhizobium sp.]|uniref:hypothetical protein n=1 Tax=Pararhizobium sp. TaxID=1977563 RepID=UPI002C439323|nr:hypothetical protein [Pararhizobium sp.]HTO32489.1 hypothetical protein [Pararhizobium sp.]
MNTFLTWLTAAGGIFGLVVTFIENFLGLDAIALLLTIVTPTLLLYARHEVRLRRLRSIKDFLLSFSTNAITADAKTDDRETGAVNRTVPIPNLKQVEVARTAANTRLTNNPSFEFVKSKYISDLQVKDPAEGKTFNQMNDIEQIDWIIKSIGRFGSRNDWKISLSAFGFVLLCYFGFSALHQTLICGLGANTSSCLQPTVDAAGIQTAETYGNWGQLAVIGSLAFAGAFVAAIRNFVRSVAVFDLSPYTFLRHTAEIVASVIFTIVLFAVFRDPMSYITDLVARIMPGATTANSATAGAGNATGEHIQPIWFGLAPLLGLIPQSATKFLLIKFQSLINWIKTTDDRFISVTKIVSLDIIDGIDYETRFRLEECGIYDVQNLATYNPIMLHIESPYGIYQVFDWIAQAQLCHILGPEKFLIFRELNIRTIFDLERAINSKYSVTAFDEICSGVLLAPTSSMRETVRISVTKPIAVDDGKAEAMEADAFCLWARRRMVRDNDSTATQHVLRWIADDLHVRRLRRLWLDISASLGVESIALPDGIDPDAQAQQE